MTPVLALGFMSGTSLDGIDAALIETDGEGHVRPIAFHGTAYSAQARAALATAAEVALAMPAPGPDPRIDAAAQLLTDLHAETGQALLAQAGIDAGRVAVAGFHGQTIAHRPAAGWTWQIGDGARLAAMLGVDVVDDLRSADVAAGGQGAPLLPVYHRALLAGQPRPLAVLNLGGVGNLTWVGEGDDLVAFDTGPANALIDDWMLAERDERFDADGALAASAAPDAAVLAAMLDNPWFDAPPPKSLDRSDFGLGAVRGLDAATGAATLTRFTAETVALGLRHFPANPTRLIVAGGGRRNPTLMAMLSDACAVTAEPIEALGWNGDATEAEGFAYMAVRSLRGLPISFPGTTGAPRPMTGGTLHACRSAAA